MKSIDKKPKAIIIVGPTAVGKTEYAIEVARRIDGEIVSADSMQIYKYMDIGSAKPTKEELAAVPHHLVDEIEPSQDFSVFDYQKLARTYMKDISNRGKTPVISGGTGLYVNALIYNMDFSETIGQKGFREELERQAETYGNEYVHEKLRALDASAAERIHPNNLRKVIRAIEIAQSGDKVRPFEESFVKNQEYELTLVGLTRDRAELYDRVNRRVDMLVDMGLVEEVKGLLAQGLTAVNIAMKGIGYKEMIGYIQGEYPLEEAIELVKKNTRHYAKRQLTWFRRYEEMNWIDLTIMTKNEAINSILEIYNG